MYDGARIGPSSSVKVNTRSPVWNELWIIKSVPQGATLGVDLTDKDNTGTTDDYIGHFETEVAAGEKEHQIVESKPFKRNRGTFRLKVSSSVHADETC